MSIRVKIVLIALIAATAILFYLRQPSFLLMLFLAGFIFVFDFFARSYGDKA